MDETRIDTLTIEIGASSDKAVKEIDKVSTAIKNLKNANRQGSRANSKTIRVDADTTPAKSKLENIESTTARLKTKTKLKIDDSDAKKAEKSVSKLEKVWSSLKRIAFYRLLRTVLREISQAISEELENAYFFSQQVGGRLAPALDSIASAGQKLKNQLGAAFGELLITLEPILVALINGATKIAQAISWLFAVLGNRDEYLVANDVAKSWKEADKSAKEYQKTILGFDVINRLNGPGSGGGKDNDYSELFHYEKTNFEMPDLRDWWKPFIDGENGAIGGVKELAQELANLEIPNLTEWWKPFVEGTSTAIEKVGDFDESLAVLPESIFVRIGAHITNPAPELTKIWNEIRAELGQFQTDFNSAFQNLMGTIRAWAAETSSVVSSTVSNVAEKINQGFQDAKNKIGEFASESIETIKNWAAETYSTVSNKVSDTYEAINQAFSRAKNNVTIFVGSSLESLNSWRTRTTEIVSTWVQSVAQRIGQGLGNARNNIVTFATETGSGIRTWARTTWEYFSTWAQGAASNVYAGLQNAADNIVTFVNSTAASIHDWATSGLRNFGEWANGVVQTVGEALSSAWENFKEFMKATGESISTWWKQNKTWVVPLGVTAAITIGAIALAPVTGGASLLAAAFASGGFPEDGLFFANSGELVGKFSNGRTAVANNEQIEAGIARAVYSAVVDAFGQNGGGSGDDRAVNIYLDGKQIAQTTTKYQRQFARVGNT